MTDNTPTPKPVIQTKPLDPVMPDELMSDFRGHSLVKIVLFTVVVHFFVLAIFSPGYIKAQVFGESDEPEEDIVELSDEEKIVAAQKDGKEALRAVADKYGITVKQLREQLDAEALTADPAASAVQDPATPEPADPASAIEREIEVEVEGPKVPDLAVDEEEDLFAPETP